MDSGSVVSAGGASSIGENFVMAASSTERMAAEAEEKTGTLCLEDLSLTEVPERVGGLLHLTSLWLSRNKITRIPKHILKVHTLTNLFLDSNEIEVLPEEISLFKNLTELNLSNNKIRELPSTICHMEKLKKLWLFDNRIRFLPPHIGKLTNLVEMRLNDNQLLSLPESVSDLSNLQTLWVQNNRLRSFPEILGKSYSLMFLWLQNNELEYCPQTMSKFKALRNLNLQNNNITDISASSFYQLEQLSYLDISLNKLSLLTWEMFSSCTKLVRSTNFFCLPQQDPMSEFFTALKESNITSSRDIFLQLAKEAVKNRYTVDGNESRQESEVAEDVKASTEKISARGGRKKRKKPDIEDTSFSTQRRKT
eukprot:Nk52_evm46s239 gene=Nk52_evmTU46s239